MKRFLILFMIIGLVAGSVATAEASKRKKATRVERTVESSYQGPFIAQVTGCDMLGVKWGCLYVDTLAQEAFFTAKVTEAHGQPVFFEVFADDQTIGSFCGKTTDPVSFPSGATLRFHVGIGWPFPVDCPANRITTTGTISVTLSNLP